MKWCKIQGVKRSADLMSHQYLKYKYQPESAEKAGVRIFRKLEGGYYVYRG